MVAIKFKMAELVGNNAVVSKVILKKQSFVSTTDIDECESDPCQNGGTCIDDWNTYNCICNASYMGDHCQTGEHAYRF